MGIEEYMIKCDFCVISKPNKNREMVCGYNIFCPISKTHYCLDAINEMKKTIDKNKIKD